MPSDSELVARARGGNKSAFDELVRRHYGLARRIARSFAAIPEDADDLVQEAFTTAYQRLPQLAEPDRFAAWLATIARNQGRMWLRQRVTQPALLAIGDDGTVSPSPLSIVSTQAARESAARRSIRETVAEALDCLSERHRHVVRMYYLEGYDYRETAALLDVPVSVVRGRLDRARCVLRKELREMTPTSPKGWQLDERDLDLLRYAAMCACEDSDRAAINALHFDGEGNLVSTDTHRMLVSNRPSFSDIPRALIHADLVRTLRDEHPDARGGQLVIEDTRATLRLDTGGMITAPLMDAQFPNWRGVIPTEQGLKMTARTGHWLQALELLAKQRENGFIKDTHNRVIVVLSPEEARVTLREGSEQESPDDISREVGASFAAQFSAGGPDMIVAMNARYIEQAIRALGLGSHEMIELTVHGELSPFVTQAAGGGSVFVVTMPMQYRPTPEHAEEEAAKAKA